MIVVTGGAGFIGSNIVKALNAHSHSDILVVDDLKNGHQYKNIVDCDICDYLDKDAFLNKIVSCDKTLNDIKAIFHEGACSNTTEWNGQFMMSNNYEYSKILLHYCLNRKIPFFYASSAAVYGNGELFKEDFGYENPLNLYGYSKFLFDKYVNRLLPTIQSQVVGLRYFNVYGPHESHKGNMASVIFHFNNQINNEGVMKLFEGTEGYKDGEQLRDFVYVDDVVNVNLWFYDHFDKSGIFNVGTGFGRSFNDVAKSVINWYGKGSIQYIKFPFHLKGFYQNFTKADIQKLRNVGYDIEFRTIEQGIRNYLEWLNEK